MATAKKPTENGQPTTSALVPVDVGENYMALQCEAHELASMIDEYLEGGLQEGDLEQIKIPTGGGLQWELPSAAGGEMANTFDGVIVGVQTTRTYWSEAFSGTGVPPDCISRDGKTGIGSPGGECETCEKNHWGSGKNNMGTACQERKRVYILRPEGFLPVILNLPITSIKNLRKYQIRLLSQHTPVNVVVTRFGLERNKSQGGILYSQVTCTSIGPLPETLAPLAKAYAKTIQAAIGIQPEIHTKTATETWPKAEADVGDGPDNIPESDPPFGPFAKEARSKTDEIPFIRADMWTELPGALTKKVL